jgi:hypothetical protein
MRLVLFAAIAAVFLVDTAVAQPTATQPTATQPTATQPTAPNGVPRIIGNRANGFSYQPTPQEVIPRERAAGLRPSAAAEEKANRDLEAIDRDLLRNEGQGSGNVPNFTPR